jgi:hypothetical protein
VLDRNSSSSRPYYEIPGFEELGLEDSWVMGIQEDASGIVFDVDFALCANHRLFAPPLPNEVNSFRRGRMRCAEPSSVIWYRKTMTPNYDLTGEADFGNFDSFYFSGDCFHLDGDWGEIEVVSAPPVVDYLEKKDAPY